jgi:hypothetical protein
MRNEQMRLVGISLLGRSLSQQIYIPLTLYPQSLFHAVNTLVAFYAIYVIKREVLLFFRPRHYVRPTKYDDETRRDNELAIRNTADVIGLSPSGRSRSHQ